MKYAFGRDFRGLWYGGFFNAGTLKKKSIIFVQKIYKALKRSPAVIIIKHLDIRH